MNSKINFSHPEDIHNFSVGAIAKTSKQKRPMLNCHRLSPFAEGRERTYFSILLALVLSSATAFAVSVITYADLQNACSTTGSDDVTISANILNGATQLTIARILALDLNGYSLTIDLPNIATSHNSNVNNIIYKN